MYWKNLVSIFILLACLITALVLPTSIQADFSLSGSDSFSGTVSVAIPITDLQITGSGTEPIPVKLRVTSGTLAMSTTTGLTFDGSSSGSTIYFSGTQTNVNNALKTLTYTRSSTGNDTLEVSLVSKGEVFFTDNNHLYKFISGTITANSARTAAASQTAYGATGYLATITSQAENDFVAARLQGDGWMGASDAGTEGDWKWITGPEAGTSFWLGVSNGQTVGGNYANWSIGEPNDYNNGVPGEDCGQFYISTGKWNDLPCSSTTLTGYVVEFGASGNIPTVTAKNIAFTIGVNPTASSLSPTDDASTVAVDANVTIVFSTTVTKSTGDILIKRTSDDTTFETIDVTSGQVTGSGTNTITINPSSNFAESTGYYVTIPATAFKDSSNRFFAGISTKTTWNFTTGDFTAPIISSVASSAITDTGATISWTTNENASSKLRYGLTNAYGTNSAETDTSPRVTSHSRSLSDLLACTTYHVAVISKDGSTNSTTSDDLSFTTTGCSASSIPTSVVSDTVTVASGGTSSLTEGSSQMQVEAPANFTSGPSSVVIQIKSLPNTDILNTYGRPATLPNEVGDIVFDVKAIINGTTVVDSFDAPVTITYTYTDSDITGLDESSLWLYHYHDGAWTALDSCTVTVATNTISCTTPSFSIFSLFGKPPATTTRSSSSTTTSTTTAPAICTTQTPGTKAPTLYAALPQSATSILLYFSQAGDPVDHYFLEYGTQPGDYKHGSVNIGNRETRTFLVESLLPNTLYYFRIHSANGCADGPASNELSARSNSLVAINQLQFARSELIATPDTNTVPTTTAPAQCQTYVTKVGDSIWNIAEEQLGDGHRYQEIIQANLDAYPSLKSSGTIRAGWTLRFGCDGQQATAQESDNQTSGYTLNVSVIDVQNSPVKGATVTLHSTPREAITDQDGIAHFTDVEPGQHQVQIAYAQYVGEQSITLDGNVKEFTLHITVEPKSVSVSPILTGIIIVMGMIILFLLYRDFRKRSQHSPKD